MGRMLLYQGLVGLSEAMYLWLVAAGLSLIFDDLVKLAFGPVYQSAPTPRSLSGAVVVFGSVLPVYHLFILGAGCVVAFGLWVFLEKTRFGLLVRATASDREMARALGVRSSRLFTIVFMAGAWLAGLGGALSIPVRSISPGMGELIIIEAFVVVVLGGLGSLRGAFLGAMAIGLLHAYGILWLPVFELALAYLGMAAVLVVRPWGLFGVREA